MTIKLGVFPRVFSAVHPRIYGNKLEGDFQESRRICTFLFQLGIGPTLHKGVTHSSPDRQPPHNNFLRM